MLRYLTSGESHGPALNIIIEGFPSGLEINPDEINHQLWCRQQGYGRGKRMQIESDQVEILSGLRFSKTLGTPLSFIIQNKDWSNWSNKMALTGKAPREAIAIHRPRPGHADLAGALKYDHQDIRNVLERASARSTATLVVLGAVARQLLKEFGINFESYLLELADFRLPNLMNIDQFNENDKVRAMIDRAKTEGDTLGGIFEVIATGVPIGLGSYSMPDKRLDGILAQAMMSIPAIKGVEIGEGFESARSRGSRVHDPIEYDKIASSYKRSSNNAGGIEGGVSNGESIRVKAAMKPLSTLYKPLDSVNMLTKRKEKATIERSDICALPAAAVVGEAVVAWAICSAFLDKFSGDSMREVRLAYDNYLAYLSTR